MVTPIVKTPVNVKTLGTAVVAKKGSTVYDNVAAYVGSGHKIAGGLPSPLAPSLTDPTKTIDPNATPAAFYVTRNNRIWGPFSDRQQALDQIDWLESRERELNVDY